VPVVIDQFGPVLQTRTLDRTEHASVDEWESV
jgi:hypothetical protein